MIFCIVMTGIFLLTVRLNNSSDGGTPVVQGEWCYIEKGNGLSVTALSRAKVPGVCSFPTALHTIHCSIVLLIGQSICGDQIFSRISDFLFSIPKCVSSALSIAHCSKAAGVRIRVPVSIIP